MSVTSAWISRRKSIKKLLIFFSHWLRLKCSRWALRGQFMGFSWAHPWTADGQPMRYSKTASSVGDWPQETSCHVFRTILVSSARLRVCLFE
ncbi:unnamed protein product [Ectocarpus sp. 6 AP-2014]